MKHILMIPLPGFGHITPLMELAKKLVPPHRVTVLVPQYLHEEMHAKLQATDNEASEHLQVRAVEDGYLQDPAHGKTAFPNLQAMCMVYYPKLLHRISTTIEKADGKADSANAVDVLIVDSQFCPVAAPAFAQKIPVYLFNTASAEGVHLKGLYYDDNCPVYDTRQAVCPLWKASRDGMQPLLARQKMVFSALRKMLPMVEGVIVNSVQEFEEETLQEMQQFAVMKDKKVFMVGPLIPEEKVVDEQDNVQKWLDGQVTQSVIYVAFGSAITPSPNQLGELGEALLATGQPFIFSLSAHLHMHLPKEIQDGAGDKFQLLTWAPQRLILEHRATQLFISHCGWNSTLETLMAGVAVLAWPLFVEQGINARMLAKQGVAVVVEEKGLAAERVVPAEVIADLIKRMNVGGNLDLRERCEKLVRVFKKAVSPDGSSTRAVRELCNELSSQRHSM